MEGNGPGVGPGEGAGNDADRPLLDLLDGLVSDRGRVAAARALGVNYRTMMNCYDSRRVSRRMREALGDFHASRGPADDAEAVGDDGGTSATGDAASLERKVTELEEENRRLRETVADQAHRLEELELAAAAPDAVVDQGGDTGAIEVGDVPGDVPVNVPAGDFGPNWRPPRRRPGMPDPGVVTLEEQPDEEHAFGPAAPLVAEWRMIRAGMGDGSVGTRVDRALAAVRRWELEAEMLRDWQLTLPPETDPLDESRRNDHVRWREESLAEARRELGRAKQARLLRRVVTLGLWRE